MTGADPIRRLLVRQPFRPFDLVMVDGTVYRVPGPEWLSVPPAETRPQEVAYYVKPDPGAATRSRAMKSTGSTSTRSWK